MALIPADPDNGESRSPGRSGERTDCIRQINHKLEL
jgi:hypothetical protein